MKTFCIFDLDGTLINSLADLATTVNQLLAAQNLSPHPIDAYRAMVGDGVDMLLKRAFPSIVESQISGLKKEFDAVYRQNCLIKTKPYPGVLKLLHQLKGKGVSLAVLSNKPDGFAKQICNHFFGDTLFHSVHGQREGIPKKPAPDGLLALLKECGFERKDAVMIGDSNVDILTANSCGISSVGALWGFRSEQELKGAGASYLAAAPEDVIDCLF